MTRVPSDDPGRIDPDGVVERVAGTMRRHILTAAQASLKALREMLSRLPAGDGEAGGPATPAPATPTSPPVSTRTATTRDPRVPPPPAAELLRSTASLPTAYGSDRLVLLARDPHCLYAYWDFSDARYQAVRTDAGSDQLRMVLRTYDVTQIPFDAAPPRRFQDFAVANDARSLYAYIGKPAACFVAEVGYLRPDGAFFALARSLPIWTPRTDQPGVAPGRWMTVGWNERRDAGTVVPLVATAPPEGAIDTAIPTATATRPAPSSWPGPSPSDQQRGSWSLVRGGLAAATSGTDS